MSARTSAAGRQHVVAEQVIADPLALGLGEGHDRAEGLEQADEVEAGDVGVEDAAEELDVVVGRGDEVGVEEGEGDAVAGAVDDDVGVDEAIRR